MVRSDPVGVTRTGGSDGNQYRKAEIHSCSGRCGSRLAARRARTEGRPDASRWRARDPDRRRSGRTGSPRALPAGVARVGLDRRPQRADRLPLGCGRCRPLSHIRGGIGRARAGRHPGLCQPERGSVATNNSYRADRVRAGRGPGRGRLGRELSAPGGQRHRVYAVRIQPQRKMARTVQRDRAQPDANCHPPIARLPTPLPQAQAPDRCRPWPATPRRCAPSCWQAPPRPP